MKSAARKRDSNVETTFPEKDDIGWRQFPVFEQVLTSEEPPALLAQVEKTCRQLHALTQSGSEADKARAQAAMTAYGRSLDLLRLIGDTRDKAAAQK
ncbi:MAG TPA: hypothetical protein VMT05_00725 [Terriglobales bacterium]|nr:hypothetical protein [Terriglobales bacterium]